MSSFAAVNVFSVVSIVVKNCNARSRYFSTLVCQPCYVNQWLKATVEIKLPLGCPGKFLGVNI